MTAPAPDAPAPDAPSDVEGLDVDRVVRRVAEQGAQALAEAWIRNAVLEAQLAAKTPQ